MKTKIQLLLILLGFSFVGYAGYLYKENVKLKNEVEVKTSNIRSLVTGIDTLTLANNQQATRVRELRFTVKELKELRREDANKLEAMGFKLNDVQSISKHSLQIKIPVSGKITPAVNEDKELITEDDDDDNSQPEFYGEISIKDEYLDVTGFILGDSIGLEVSTTVNLDQVVYAVPKHKFLWWSWGVKAVNQVITTDNPHVKINYSEYITIDKKR